MTKARLLDLCGLELPPLELDPRRKRSTDALASIFLENVGGSGIKYYKPRFFFAFGLPSLLCHLVGSLLLLLQYKLVHPWRQLGREREANLWGKLGGTKQGLDEEACHWRNSDAVMVSFDEFHRTEQFPTLSLLLYSFRTKLGDNMCARMKRARCNRLTSKKHFR